MRRLFIVGSQGIPAEYGGLETFTHQLATRLADRGWPVWVGCETAYGDATGPEEYEGVRLFHVEAPDNHLRTIVADRKALLRSGELADPGDVVYLLGYGVGPFAWGGVRSLGRAGVEFWLNPDGLEWKRPRWPWPVQRYFRFSEGFLLRRADRVICDAAAIRDHHGRAYGVPRRRMEVIEYGAPVVEELEDDSLTRRRDEWLERYDLEPGDYHTYVGRFVPDNNLELMVRGMLDGRIGRRLLVFAAHDEEDPFYRRIADLIESSDDPGKVILTGGVYDQELLQALRLGGHAYFHGHEVGGTNPALVEAMGLGSLVLALDTPYNREVLQDAGLFFQKDVESFVETVRAAESMGRHRVEELRERARDRVRDHYNWKRITDAYERLLESDGV